VYASGEIIRYWIDSAYWQRSGVEGDLDWAKALSKSSWGFVIFLRVYTKLYLREIQINPKKLAHLKFHPLQKPYAFQIG